MKNLQEIVQQISDYEHMGQVHPNANIDIQIKSNSLTLQWDAIFEGETVRQAAYFKFTGICLGPS
jgi:hypothetical protein